MMQATQSPPLIEAETAFGMGQVRLVRRFWTESFDTHGVSSTHHFELAMLPRSNRERGCFPERWGPDRFEPIGEVFLLPAHQPVHAKSECRHQHSVVCEFEPEQVSTWLDGEFEWTDARLKASLNITNPTIRTLLFRLGEEVRNPGFASGVMIDSVANQIVVEFARYCLGIEQTRVAGGLAPRKLRLIDERLAEVGPAPSLSELAALCGMSVRHLTRSFRASRCRSIGNYIVECQTNHAKRLLASGASVKTVAYTLGFNSPSNFSIAFRRATGESPREYQQRANRRPTH
jgi:AraC family transcriptional regulator